MSEDTKPDDKKTCFFVSPIGMSRSEERKQSDMVKKYIVEAGLGDEFKVKRADEDSRPGMITTQMIQDIRDSDLIVADLSGVNPNVMYELGIAHTMRRPVVHLIDDQTTLPFDVKMGRMIVYDLDDVHSHEGAAKALGEQAEHAVTSDFTPSPVSEAEVGDVRLNQVQEVAGTIGELRSHSQQLEAELVEIRKALSNDLIEAVTIRPNSFPILQEKLRQKKRSKDDPMLAASLLAALEKARVNTP